MKKTHKKLKSFIIAGVISAIMCLNILPVFAGYTNFSGYTVDRYTFTRRFPGANKVTSDNNILFKITDTNGVSKVRVWAINSALSTISDTYYMTKGSTKTISFSKGTYPSKGQWVSAEYKNDNWSTNYAFFAGGIDYK